MIEAATTERPAPVGARRRDLLGAGVLGALDGLLGVALPVLALAAIAVAAWAALGAPSAWLPFARAGAVAWWIGHGVDVRFAASGAPFTVTAAALGPALVTTGCAIRAGRRARVTAAPVAAWASGVVATAAACVAVLLAGGGAAATPVAWQAIVLPVALVAVVSLLALRRDRPLPPGVRAGLAAAALLLGASGLLLAATLLARFSDVIGLYETLSPGPVGGIVLTLLQVLALPTFVVWTAAWASGGAVALGTASATGAFGASVGPLPALPVLAAVPGDPPPAVAAVLLIPVLAGFAGAALARRSGGRGNAALLGLTAGLVAGAVIGLLTAATAGSAGPGRFVAVGPDALVVALLVAGLTGVPAMLAAAVVRPARAEPPPVAEDGLIARRQPAPRR